MDSTTYEPIKDVVDLFKGLRLMTMPYNPGQHREQASGRRDHKLRIRKYRAKKERRRDWERRKGQNDEIRAFESLPQKTKKSHGYWQVYPTNANASRTPDCHP